MKTTGKYHFAILPTGYVAVLLMILLAAWNPSLPAGSGPVDLLLLLDESSSIAPEQNDAVWQSFLQQARSLPEGSRISLMRFTDRASVEVPWTSTRHADFEKLLLNQHPPRHRLLDPGASAIGPAVGSATQYSSPDRPTALILASDGIDSITPAQTSFPVNDISPNLSLFYLQTEHRRQGAGLNIESINLPAIVDTGPSLPVSIAIESVKHSRGILEVLLNEHIAIQQALVVEPAERRVVYLQLPVEQPGRQNIEILLRDEQDNIIDTQRHVLDYRETRKLLYIGNPPFTSGVPSLQRDGWHITPLAPQQIPLDETFFRQFDTIVLDDIEASSIDVESTRNLIHVVQQSGSGLIVLGGQHSFGSGGYRHSELESILPVTAEASRPLPGSAFVFLLDKSGSMEASNSGVSGLAQALRAVSESAKSLRSGDESALLVFDREVNVLLPLKRRADPMHTLDQDWRLQPAGGTQLVPALQQAIDLLANSDSKQRFLILVTDGFVEGNNTEPLQQALQQAGIKLIALVIGGNTDLSTLQRLTAINTGQLLSVNETTELPRFMRQQLEMKQHSWNPASVIPRSIHPAPFIPVQNTAWQSLDGYQITRARPSASAYLATDNGDPLLAVGQSGAGKVAALPGGLPDTLSDDDLLSGLLSWMDSRQQNPNLQISHTYLSGQISLVVDAVDSANRWHPATTALLTLTSPNGITRSQPLAAVAPGRYSATLQAPAVGIYSARVEVGDQRTLYSAYLSGDSERRYHTSVPWLEHSLSAGTIRRWTATERDRLLAASSGHFPTRPLLLLLALCCYLFLIAFERSAGLQATIRFLSRLKSRSRNA